MNAELNLTTRQPGQRPRYSRREEILIDVERAMIRGLMTPTQILDAVPEVGTWDTAKAYIGQIQERRRKAADREEQREARAEMVAAIKFARERAIDVMTTADKPGEVARLGREVERLVRTEAWLRDIHPENLAEGEDEREIRDPREWIPTEIEDLEYEMEQAGDSDYGNTLAKLIETLKLDLAEAEAEMGPLDVENPSTPRTDPANPTGDEETSP